MTKSLCGVALMCFLTIYSYSQNLLDRRTEIDSLNAKAFRIRAMDETASMAHARKALYLSSMIYDDDRIRSSCLNVAINFTNLGQYDSAFRYLRRLEKPLRTPLEEGVKEYYTGRIYSEIRDYKRAKVHLDRAHQIFLQNEIAEFCDAVPNTLGTIEGRQGNYEQALTYFLESMNLAAKYGYNNREAIGNVSTVYMFLKQYDKALDFRRRQKAKILEAKDSGALVMNYMAMSDLFKSMNRHDSAMIYIERAAKTAELNHLETALARTMIRKAALMKDTHPARELVPILWEVVKRTEKTNLMLRQTAYEELAKAYEKSKSYDSAIWYAKKSFIIADTTNTREEARVSAKLLTDLYRQQGKFDSALRYAEHTLHISESLANANKEDEISNLRVRMETLEYENEIKEMRNRTEKLRLRNERIILLFILIIGLSLGVLGLVILQQKIKNKKLEIEQLNLRSQVDRDRTNLYQQTLHMVQLSNCLDDIHNEVKGIMADQFDVRLARILNMIKTNKTLENDWKNFNHYFSSVHSEFYGKLNSLSSDLTTHEKKVCALIKLNLSTREIATLLGIEQKSVSMIKYRIKKKLKLTEAEELEAELQKL